MVAMGGSGGRIGAHGGWLLAIGVGCGSGGHDDEDGTSTATEATSTASTSSSSDEATASAGTQGTTTAATADETASETSGGPVDLPPGFYRIAFHQTIEAAEDFVWLDVDGDTLTPTLPLLSIGHPVARVSGSHDGRWLAAVEQTTPQVRRGWVVEPALLDGAGGGTWPISPELPGDQERFSLAPFFADDTGLVYTDATGGQMLARARTLGDGGPGPSVSIGPAFTGTVLYTHWLAPEPLDRSGLVLVRLVQAGEPEQLFSVPASTRTDQWTPLAAFSPADDNEAIVDAYLSPSLDTVYARTLSGGWWVADASLGAGTFTPMPMPAPAGGSRTCTMAPSRTRLVCADLNALGLATPLFMVGLDETTIAAPVFVALPTFEGSAVVQSFQLLSDGRGIALALVDAAAEASALLVGFDAAAGPEVVELSGPSIDGRMVTAISPSPDESLLYLSADVSGSVFGRVDLTVAPPPPVEIVAQLDASLAIDSKFAISADGTTAFFAATVDPRDPLLRVMQRCDLTNPDAPEVPMGEPTTDAIFDVAAAPNGRAVLYSTLAANGERPLWLSEYLGTTTTHHQLSAVTADRARFLIAQ